MFEDTSLARAGRHGTYEEYAFFDKVKCRLGNDVTYMNFMRCLKLYTDDVISGRELLYSLRPFLAKLPDVARDMRELFGLGDSLVEPISEGVANARKPPGFDPNMDIDYASCRRLGASYRPLPSTYQQPVCSGRTALDNEVLNDVWVSFPSWSEDTTFGESRITAYQEFLYRCEDERFELDIVIDTISSTAEVLDGVLESLSRMSADEARDHQLDDRLGGGSEVLQRRAIQRIYGDKASQMIDGIKKRPSVALPIVVRRLKAKVMEWQGVKVNYNRIWREQNDKQAARCLASDAGTVKQTEAREIRSKALINEAVALFEEGRARRAAGQGAERVQHMELVYSDDSVLSDASALLRFHACQTLGNHSDEAVGIARLLANFLPRVLGNRPVSSPSDSELDGASVSNATSLSIPFQGVVRDTRVMYANSVWCVFLRLHHRLCERLLRIRTHAARLAEPTAPLVAPNGVKSLSVYEHTLTLIRCQSEGLVDTPAYESALRKCYGPAASITFTVDRLLQHIIKQLQTLVTDEASREILRLFNGGDPFPPLLPPGAGGTPESGPGVFGAPALRALDETVHRRRATELCVDELCFRVVFYKQVRAITVEVLAVDSDGGAGGGPDDPLEVQGWADYVENFVDFEAEAEDLCPPPGENGGTGLPVFLKRCLQSDRRDKTYLRRVSVMDNTRCQFGVGLYRMCFSAGSASSLYLHGALRRARQTSHRLRRLKHNKFALFHSTWLRANVSGGVWGAGGTRGHAEQGVTAKRRRGAPAGGYRTVGGQRGAPKKC